MPNPAPIPVGVRFGALHVQSRRQTAEGWRYLCQCACGNQAVLPARPLLRGRRQTCGCEVKLRPISLHQRAVALSLANTVLHAPEPTREQWVRAFVGLASAREMLMHTALAGAYASAQGRTQALLALQTAQAGLEWEMGR